MKVIRHLTLLSPLLVITLFSPQYFVLAQPAAAADPVSVLHAPGDGESGKTHGTPVGIFDGQSDIGGAPVPGSATYDSAAQEYSINSAGSNAAYTRDDFHYLWKKMSGDVSLTADIALPDPTGNNERKAMLVIRQSLDDDSKEAVVAVYGSGVFKLGQRPGKGVALREMQYRVWSKASAGGAPGSMAIAMPKRVSLQKHGDVFVLYVSIDGEPMHPFGTSLSLHIDEPFYVGIAFTSDLPDKSDTAAFSNVAVEDPTKPAAHRAASEPPTSLPTRTIP